MKVFVVENDASYARFLATVAEQCGCSTSTYYCGQSALRDAEVLKPDVVLLSLSLPDIDSLKFVRLFRQHRALQSTSIVAVSGDLLNASECKRFSIDTSLVYPWHQAGVECLMQRLAIAADKQVVIPPSSFPSYQAAVDAA
jgi:CheY-like chemotaxis protein